MGRTDGRTGTQRTEDAACRQLYRCHCQAPQPDNRDRKRCGFSPRRLARIESFWFELNRIRLDLREVMMISESEAKKITDKVLSLSKADSCVVTLSGHKRRHLRFALNSVTTNGEQDDLVLSVSSAFGNRSGSSQTNDLKDDAVAAAVKKSEEIAKFAPPDPEFMPPLGPQTYLPARTYFEKTAQTSPEQMSDMCKPVLDSASGSKVSAAGFSN